MANKFRGEATLEREEGENLLLIFDTNAFAVLETAWDKSMKQVIGYIASWTEDTFRMGDLITLLYAAVHRSHRLSEDECGDIISELGQEKVTEILMLAIKRAMPEAKAAPVGEAKPPVGKKKIGTGTKR